MKVDLRQIKGRCRINPRTECWEWMNCVQSNGYGRITVNRKTMYVHRYVYELVNGPIPERRNDVMHVCDNRRCCNPEHLIAGTRLNNMRDAQSKGRLSRGRVHAMRMTQGARRRATTKLTIELAREIRSRCAAGERTTDIAAAFSISPSNVRLITRGKAWRDAAQPLSF